MSAGANCERDGLLARLGARARVVRHADLGRDIRTARDFAEAVGCAPERVAKTLLLRAGPFSRHDAATRDRAYAAVVLAVVDRVDLRAIASALGAASATLASKEELQQVLGTVPGAVSPFALGEISLCLDGKLLNMATVFVSGGSPGVDIEIAPADLAEITAARVGRYSLSREPQR